VDGDMFGNLENNHNLLEKNKKYSFTIVYSVLSLIEKKMPDIIDEPFCKDLLTYKLGNGVMIFELLEGIPTFVFFIYMVYKLRSSLNKLYETESLIMSTYYGFLW
jgi:hypothetical protein